MRYPSLSPSVEAGARVVFEALAATVEVESRPDRQALFSRYAGYYAALSRLPRRLRRRLQRRWRRSLAAIALLLALGQAPALAATLTVAPGVAPDIASDGACSLIEAIENANADFQRHGDCPAGNGPDTIVLPASSTRTLTQVHNSTDGYTGLPVISSAITIEGKGGTVIRDPSAPAFRIFAVNATGDLALNETTVSGGAATRFTGPQFSSAGGGILVVSGGRLSITNSTVAGNSASYGGGVQNVATATLTNSTVSGNTAYFGGGVANTNVGIVTFTNSTVSGNTASFGGGGGVQNVATATFTNSTVSGNSAAGIGGGVVNYGDATATLTNSTVSGNSAGLGGGVYIHGTVTLARSLVSGNTAPTGAEIRQASGNVIADSFNLFGHSGLTDNQAFSGFTPGATDLVATSNGDVPTPLGAILDTTLADNGGPTKTHALVAGSPAIDAVATGCPPPTTDQREVGRPQPQGGDCDIGAFEIISDRTADLSVSLTDIPDPLKVNGRLVYTATVRNDGPGTAMGVQVSDTLPVSMVLAGPPSASRGQCGGTRTVTCNLGTLAVGDQATVTINVIPTATGVFTNIASVVGNEPDPARANNSATETTTVEPPDPALADLAVAVAAAPEPGASGQALTYTITARNDGPATATGVQLTDDLPPGVGLGRITPSQGTCRGTDPVLCDLGALPSGVQATVAIDVVPAQAGVLSNQATVNGNQSEPNPGNNSATITTTVQPPLEPPTRQTACNTVRCQLRLTCNLSELLGRNCDNRVRLFVRAASARQVEGALAKAKKPINFAGGVANVAPNVTKNLRLKLTQKGTQVASTLIQQGKKTLRGEMRISNAAGGIDIIPLRLRLK